MRYRSDDEIIAKDGRSELQDTRDVSRKIRCRATWRTETQAELTRMEGVWAVCIPQGRGGLARKFEGFAVVACRDAALQLSTADLQIECRWKTSGGVWCAAPSILMAVRIGDSLGVHVRLLHISG